MIMLGLTSVVGWYRTYLDRHVQHDAAHAEAGRVDLG